MESILTRNQKKNFTKFIKYQGISCKMSVTISFDDECKNGHNTFTITGTIKGLGNYRGFEAAGCIHDEIREYFPEFTHLIKWHLVSTDGPLHYIANTKYFVSKNNIDSAKSTAVWGVTDLDTDENIKFLDDEVFLQSRLSKLLEKFKIDIEALGFVY